MKKTLNGGIVNVGQMAKLVDAVIQVGATQDRGPNRCV